jgi:hypothetical protein
MIRHFPHYDIRHFPHLDYVDLYNYCSLSAPLESWILFSIYRRWKLVDSAKDAYGANGGGIVVNAVVDSSRCKFMRAPQYSVSAQAASPTHSYAAGSTVLPSLALQQSTPFIAFGDVTRGSFTVVVQLPPDVLSPFNPRTISNKQVTQRLQVWSSLSA